MTIILSLIVVLAGFLILVLIRNEIVHRARIKEIERVGELTKNYRGSDWRIFHKKCWDEYDKRTRYRNRQVFDLTKWTYKQFFLDDYDMRETK